METERYQTEFGLYTTWIAEAVEALGITDPVPVVCRGTGHPELLAHLAGSIGARPGMLVLDAGCGMGGPGAWLRRNRGCQTIGVDLMESNVRAARRLFDDDSTVVAGAARLPFRAQTFDAVWAVGVLEMIEDKARTFEEIGRVLKVGGRCAIYTFTAPHATFEEPPRSDYFVSADDVQAFATRAGLAIGEAEPVGRLSPLPEDWRASRTAVAGEIRSRHSSEREFADVMLELDRFNRLRMGGFIEAWRFQVRKEGR